MELGLPKRGSDEPTVIAPEIIEAYRVTDYSFDAEGRRVDFHIDERCSHVADLIQRFGNEGACLITAYNPLGIRVGDSDNRKATELLLRDLESRRLQFLPAKGEDPLESKAPEMHWAELGFMIFGLSRQEAMELGWHYKQNAIVWVDRDGFPELVLLR